jgi:integrase
VIHYGGESVRDIRKAWAKVEGKSATDSPHVLRHSCATWLVSSGKGPLPEISSYLGMSLEVLRSVYWHHSPEFQRNAASAGPMVGQ